MGDNFTELCDRHGLPECYELDPVDAFDKYGFDDGDLFADLIAAYRLERGWSRLDEDGCEDALGEVVVYVNSSQLLWDAWRRFVAPSLPAAVTVERCLTLHNVVRAVADDPPAGFNPPTVTVAVADLFALADEMFPHRDAGWLHLYAALLHGPLLADRDAAAAECDAVAGRLEDWRLGLAAEQIAAGRGIAEALEVSSAL